MGGVVIRSVFRNEWDSLVVDPCESAQIRGGLNKSRQLGWRLISKIPEMEQVYIFPSSAEGP